MSKKFMRGVLAVSLFATMALAPAAMATEAVDTSVADKDAKTITVEKAVPRVDYVSNVVYKQVSTPNSNKSLVLDMLLPKLADDAKAPVVMFVKGSGFTAMNLDGFMEQRMYLATKGYAVIEVETQVVPQVVFPQAVKDIKEGIRYVRAHADEFNLDTEKIAIWGDSSGGYMATMVAVTNGVKDFEEGANLDQSSDVACCVDFYGPTDLTTIGEGLGEDVEKSHDSAATTEAMLVNGTAFGDNPGGSINSDPEKAAAANPLTYIDEKDPAFQIFHGTADVLVSPYESKILYQALKDKGVSAELNIVTDATHGGVDFYQPQVLDMVVDFLNAQMGK
jgi:acetyl esterase/lipase